MVVFGAMDHRGRHQAQGEDIPTGNCSEPWAQSAPYLASTAHADLSTVEARLSKSARALRAKSFKMARRHINNAQQNGGVGPHSMNFPVLRQDEVPDARVDIEVHAGLAFT